MANSRYELKPGLLVMPATPEHFRDICKVAIEAGAKDLAPVMMVVAVGVDGVEVLHLYAGSEHRLSLDPAVICPPQAGKETPLAVWLACLERELRARLNL